MLNLRILTYLSKAIVLDDFFALQTETTFLDNKKTAKHIAICLTA